MKYANFVPPPNDQRTDPKWEWDGVRIVGNSQCQGNSNEDVLKDIAMEFELNTLAHINTYNYYAMYFAYLKSVDPGLPKREMAMFWLNHAAFIDFMIRENKLPLKVVCYSSINDRPRIKDRFELKQCENSSRFLASVIEKTGRIVSVGTHILPSGHWRRFHAFDEVKLIFEENDPYGTPPYKTPSEKKQTIVKTKYNDLEKQKIRRIISIEDKF